MLLEFSTWQTPGVSPSPVTSTAPRTKTTTTRLTWLPISTNPNSYTGSIQPRSTLTRMTSSKRGPRQCLTGLSSATPLNASETTLWRREDRERGSWPGVCSLIWGTKSWSKRCKRSMIRREMWMQLSRPRWTQWWSRKRACGSSGTSMTTSSNSPMASAMMQLLKRGLTT